MPERVAVGLGAVVAMVGLGFAWSLGEITSVALFGGCVVLGHIATLPDRVGRHRTVAPAVVVTAAMLDVPILAIAAALAWGVPVGWVAARIAHGGRTGGDAGAASAVGGVGFLLVFGGAHQLIGHATASVLVSHLVAAVLGASAWLCATAWLISEREGRRQQDRRRTVFRRELDGWPVQAALVAIGALLGLTLEPLGWLAAVVMAGLPYGLVHLSLARLDRARSTFASTVQALGRIPEVGGYSPKGRSERVARLAVGVGAELGLRTAQLETLDQAARLHALGTVVLNDPAIARSMPTERDIAQWGAAIVGESPSLQAVADVISTHLEPYRRDGEAGRDEVTIEARVLRAALAFDSASSGSRTSEEALDGLHRAMAYDFDPGVVVALRRHLVRRGLIAA